MTTPNECQFWDCGVTIRRNHSLCYDHYNKSIQGAVDQCQLCERYKSAEHDICKTCYQSWKEASELNQPSAARQRTDYSDEALLEELRSLRRKLASEHHLRDYRVFSNAVLADMVNQRPLTQEAMRAIPGVGPVTMDRFGWHFLRVIQQRAAMNYVQQAPQPPPSNVPQRDNREFAADKDADRFFVYVLLLNNGEYYIGQTRDFLARLKEHRNNMSQSTRGREPKLRWFTTVQTRKEAADLEARLQHLNSNPASRRKIVQMVVDFENLVKELDYDPHQPTAHLSVQERPRPYGGVAPPSFRRNW